MIRIRSFWSVFAALALLLAWGLSGCQPSTPAETEPTAIRVTDAAGQTVELEELPNRIVVVGRGPYMALHLLYMFPEGRQRLVGIEVKGETASDFLPYVDAAFTDIPTLASNPGSEQIATLDPDLVIMKGYTVEGMSKSLSQVGIPVVYLGLETPDQFRQDVTNLGILLGSTDRAQEILDFYNSRIERLQKGLKGIDEDDKPRVLLLEYSDRGSKVAVQVPARQWIQTIEVETAGGAPVWLGSAELTDGWTVVNFEQIAQWNPDKIFVVIWYTLDPEEVIATLKADPKWSTLDAVKNDQLYAFPSDIFGWDSPEPRWILGMTWLATKIHPDRFADLDMSEEIHTFFTEMFDMKRDVIDAEIMSRVKLDVH
ncbi:MAG: hypothetical protein A2Y73_03340 [Chloroflexi bacterium RBG_13_56_8]|nr:MAG: hypothetical protein A2Y73_03340 [Chloroflexi bacterium RBG_13_56_8]